MPIVSTYRNVVNVAAGAGWKESILAGRCRLIRRQELIRVRLGARSPLWGALRASELAAQVRRTEGCSSSFSLRQIRIKEKGPWGPFSSHPARGIDSRALGRTLTPAGRTACVRRVLIELLSPPDPDKRKGPMGALFFYPDLAEREGFEPSIELLTLYSLSRGAPSATRPSLRSAQNTGAAVGRKVTRGLGPTLQRPPRGRKSPAGCAGRFPPDARTRLSAH
jgi:hypothetical protein